MTATYTYEDILDELQQENLTPTQLSVEVRLEPFTIVLARGRLNVNYDWTVRHERYGVLRANIPADSLEEARREASKWLAQWIANEHRD